MNKVKSMDYKNYYKNTLVTIVLILIFGSVFGGAIYPEIEAQKTYQSDMLNSYKTENVFNSSSISEIAPFRSVLRSKISVWISSMIFCRSLIFC